MKSEADYQADLKKRIEKRFPGAIVLKNDPKHRQGIPDLTVLWKDKWAALEVKRSAKEKHRPNQDRRVEQMNDMSFSSFIFPENEQEVLDAMERSFSGVSCRRTRNVRSK